MANDLSDRIRSIVTEQFGIKPADVTKDASILDDLGADSLDVVELVMALEEAFDDTGLPWTSSLQSPLRRHPVVRDFLLLLQVVAQNFPRQITAALLRSPRIRWTSLLPGRRSPGGHRAETPADPAARQHERWQPLLDWVAAHWGARLEVTVGVIPLAQRDDARDALRAVVAGFDDLALAALHALTAASGSLVIALAVAAGRIDADEAWSLSQLDESHQVERWGEDAEAAGRRARLREEIRAAARLLALARG